MFPMCGSKRTYSKFMLFQINKRKKRTQCSSIGLKVKQLIINITVKYSTIFKVKNIAASHLLKTFKQSTKSPSHKEAQKEFNNYMISPFCLRSFTGVYEKAPNNIYWRFRNLINLTIDL